MNEVLRAIKNRRSIRSFSPEQIKQEELDLIIEAAVYAPSSHNEQPWHFTVIQNRELIRYISDKPKELMAQSDVRWIKLMGLSKKREVTYGAPTLIIVSGKEDAISWMPECSAAVQNMLIAAESMDIGSIWLGLVTFFFNLKDEIGILKIPEGYVPFCGAAFGYKLKEYTQGTPKRNFDVVDYIR